MKDRPAGLRTWMELRSIGNSPIVQASVLFPIIGYLILFNDQVSTFLSMTGFEQAGPASGLCARLSWLFDWIWIRKLHFIYFGLMSFGIGSLIYSWRCPFIIKKHGDFADYVRIDGPSISNDEILQYAKEMGIAPAFLSETESLLQRKSDLLHHWYARKSAEDRIARDAVTVLFRMGFVLVSVPSVVSVLKISGLF